MLKNVTTNQNWARNPPSDLVNKHILQVIGIPPNAMVWLSDIGLFSMKPLGWFTICQNGQCIESTRSSIPNTSHNACSKPQNHQAWPIHKNWSWSFIHGKARKQCQLSNYYKTTPCFNQQLLQWRETFEWEVIGLFIYFTLTSLTSHRINHATEAASAAAAAAAGDDDFTLNPESQATPAV